MAVRGERRVSDAVQKWALRRRMGLQFISVHEDSSAWTGGLGNRMTDDVQVRPWRPRRPRSGLQSPVLIPHECVRP